MLKEEYVQIKVSFVCSVKLMACWIVITLSASQVNIFENTNVEKKIVFSVNLFLFFEIV